MQESWENRETNGTKTEVVVGSALVCTAWGLGLPTGESNGTESVK